MTLAAPLPKPTSHHSYRGQGPGMESCYMTEQKWEAGQEHDVWLLNDHQTWH